MQKSKEGSQTEERTGGEMPEGGVSRTGEPTDPLARLTDFAPPLLAQVREALERLRVTDPEVFTLPDAQRNALLAERITGELADQEPPGDGNLVLWQRFANQAKQALRFAYEEARRMGAPAVCPEHLLLGLLYEDDTIAGKLLRRMDRPVADIRSEIQRQMEWQDLWTHARIPLASHTKQVIDHAYQEAKELNDQYIGTEHLLIGLMREGTSVAAHVLAWCEVSADKARSFLLLIREEQNQQEAEAGVPTPRPDTRAQPVIIPEPRFGDRGKARSMVGRNMVEVAMDSAAYRELDAVYRAHDGHGYRHLVEGQQTMFLVPTDTTLKRLVPPADSDEATAAGGMYVRVLDGEYEGYAGWIFSESFACIGADDSPFPPVIE
ncbi:MAG: hypothetical protein OHK0029_38020 [Armatimonadaceae bacterium]